MKVLKMKERKKEGQTSCESGIAPRFENEEEEESWQERDQMAEQWKEEQKLEGIVGKKKNRRKLLKFRCHAKSTGACGA